MIKLVNGMKLKDVPRDSQDLIDKLVRSKILKTKKDEVKFDSKHRVGIVDVNRTGTGFLEVLGYKVKDLIIEKENLKNANRGDLVIAKRIFTKNRRPSCVVVEVLKKQFDYSVVYLQKVKDKIVGINIKTELPMELTTATQKSLKKLPPLTVLKINNYTEIIEDVLGVLTDPSIDEKISLALFNKKEEFSNEAELEAKSFGDFVDKSMYSDRVDLTHLPFCTIDPNDAKDFDDAIYYDIEKNELYVAIADVSEYVYPDNNIDKEAKLRCFSIYLPHKSIPMLPRSLSENICSLKPDEDRLAFTFKISLNDNFEVVKEELLNTVINSKRRFTYDEIDEYLDGKSDFFKEVDKEVLKFLFPLYEVTKKLKKRRLKKGYDFRSDEVRVELNEKFTLIDSKIEDETASHSLIEDCMLLANRAAAKVFDFGIFRIHEEPSEAKIDELLDNLGQIGIYPNDTYKDLHSLVLSLQKEAERKDLSKFVDKLIIKSQKQAKYSSENIGHFGLGFKDYTHFTSPIRRYSDLTLHRLLKANLRNDKKQREYLLRNIESLTARISDLEREAVKVEWDFLDRVFVRWAIENIGVRIDGVITDTDRNPICKIDNGILNGARVFLIDKSELDLFDNVTIEIVDCNLATAKIYGEIIENRGLER